jgi:hypothetical protein
MKKYDGSGQDGLRDKDGRLHPTPRDGVPDNPNDPGYQRYLSRHCGRTDYTKDKPKKSDCYVATAVYGSYDAPHVISLRRYRDERLSKSIIGRLFIKTYYKLSPPIAARLVVAKRTNSLVKILLDAIVKSISKNK